MLAEFFGVVVAVLGDFGFQKAAVTAAFCLDFFGAENKAGRLEGSNWYALHLVQVVEGAGGVESGLAGGDALGFHVLKGLCGVSQNAVEALLVHAEIYESLGVPAIDGGGGEGGVDFGMSGVDLGFRAEVAESEHAVFDGAHAVETPLGVDDGLGALAFGEGRGGEIG